MAVLLPIDTHGSLVYVLCCDVQPGYLAPPTVRIEPEMQTIGQGEDAELLCVASGEPAPSISWQKVSQSIQ